MSAPSKANSTGGVRIVPPLGKGQQVMKAAGVTAQAVVEEKSHDGGFQTSPRLPSAARKNTAVLHQTGGKLPKIPIRTAIGGFAIVFAIGYFTLGSKKKAEVTATDAARVAKPSRNFCFVILSCLFLSAVALFDCRACISCLVLARFSK